MVGSFGLQAAVGEAAPPVPPPVPPLGLVPVGRAVVLGLAPALDGALVPGAAAVVGVAAAEALVAGCRMGAVEAVVSSGPQAVRVRAAVASRTAAQARWAFMVFPRWDQFGGDGW